VGGERRGEETHGEDSDECDIPEHHAATAVCWFNIPPIFCQPSILRHLICPLAELPATRSTTLPRLPRPATRSNAARASASGNTESISGRIAPSSASRASSTSWSRFGPTAL